MSNRQDFQNILLKEEYKWVKQELLTLFDMDICRQQVKSKYPEIICIHPDQVWEYLT